MTMEIDALTRGNKMRPLDPCEDCLEKDAEIRRLRNMTDCAHKALIELLTCHLGIDSEAAIIAKRGLWGTQSKQEKDDE